MNRHRFQHGMTLLGNGDVLATGGYGQDVAFGQPAVLSSSEVFRISTGDLGGDEPHDGPRAAHSATLFPRWASPGCGRCQQTTGHRFGRPKSTILHPIPGNPPIHSRPAGKVTRRPCSRTVLSWLSEVPPRTRAKSTTPPPEPGACDRPPTCPVRSHGDPASRRRCPRRRWCYDDSQIRSLPLQRSSIRRLHETPGRPSVAFSDARYGHSATLLPTGEVMVAGGCGEYADWECTVLSSETELFDPETGTWSDPGISRLLACGTPQRFSMMDLSPSSVVIIPIVS